MRHSYSLEIVDLGVMSYDRALSQQMEMVDKRRQTSSTDRLILVEHPPVITIGRKGGASDIHLSQDALDRKGVAVIPVDRGGQATYHGPGQMVAYPIVELTRKDVHWFVDNALGAVADVLKEYSLIPEIKSGQPGVWIKGKKIAFIGVALKKWVTYHGISLNVNNDLTPFDWFVPCGHPEEVVTSMEMELGRSVDITAVKDRFIRRFRERFGYTEKTGAKHPDWLTLRAPENRVMRDMGRLLVDLNLGTVCQSAHCPNVGECFGRGTATFMILGSQCTRTCRFCAVNKGVPEPLDAEEPRRVAEAVKKLGLAYAVITSVTRDDLPDGGAGQFARTIDAVRRSSSAAGIEILVPDFNGSQTALETVFSARPDMFNHNIETVPRLYATVRPGAVYARSLELLGRVKTIDASVPTKSGLMLGLGETTAEIRQTLQDLLDVGCRMLTIGQYLQPSKDHLPVARFVPPTEFDQWQQTAFQMGFSEVASGPFVRSSYHAKELFNASNP